MKTRFIHEISARVVTRQYEKDHEAVHVVVNKKTYEEALAYMKEHSIFDDASQWPTKCDHCSYVFSDERFRSVSPERVYDTPSGKPEPGDMFFEPCRGQGAAESCFHWDNCDGMHLYAICPDGTVWDIDSRANNCTMKEDRLHRCWVRTGTPPDVTAGKGGHTCNAGAGSIQTHSYHGMLQNGEFNPDATPPPALTAFSWDNIQRGPCGKVKLLYRHERVFSEPFMPTVKDVLDVGGWGVLATRMIEEGKSCIILDKFTHDQYYADRVRALPHKKGDVLSSFCFQRDTFDLVTCFECLEHVGGLDSVSVAIMNIQCWLRPGGWFVGTVPLPGATHAADEEGITFLDEKVLRTLLGGFTDILVEPTVSIGLPGEKPSSLYFRARKS